MSGLAFVLVWTAGMALMMLPSALPLLRLDFATARSGPAGGSTRRRRQDALADVFLGRLSGPRVDILPWVRKARHLLHARVSTIELVHDGEGYRLRVGDAVRLRATRPVESTEPVSCVISGYDRIGRELYAEELIVDDDPFTWELSGNCAFASDFEYASE